LSKKSKACLSSSKLKKLSLKKSARFNNKKKKKKYQVHIFCGSERPLLSQTLQKKSRHRLLIKRAFYDKNKRLSAKRVEYLRSESICFRTDFISLSLARISSAIKTSFNSLAEILPDLSLFFKD
jgi:hypothetical protein